MNAALRNLLSTAILVLLGACSSGKHVRSTDLQHSFQWQTLAVTIENAREQSKTETTVVALTAHWGGVTSSYFDRAIQDPAVLKFLAHRSVEGFIADCTFTNSPGWRAVLEHGEQAAPVSFAIWKRGRQLEFVRPEITPQGITPKAVIAAIAPYTR